MIKNYEMFVEHLRRTGRLKLLPAVLRELKAEAARAKKLAPRYESAAEHPVLISGARSIEGGWLTDRTGKAALIEIYRHVTN